MTQLNLLVFGAGAIGTYIGGSLARTGHQITFIEQPQAISALRERGLRLDLSAAHTSGPHAPESHFVIPSSRLNCETSVERALLHGPFDVAIFALKSFDTPSVLEGLIPFRDSLPPFLCLQNGVENEAILEDALGADGVIAGTVTSAVGRRDVGDIVLERLRGVGVAAGHSLSHSLVSALVEAGLHARLYSDGRAMKWSKLLTNLLANSTSAILDMTPAEIFAHPGAYQIEIKALREALDVMAAQNIPVIDLPGTPVRLLSIGARIPLAVSRPLMARFAGKGRGDKMPSLHIDLHHGRGMSEVGYLNGAVVRFGARLGVPTPVNQLLLKTLQQLTDGELSTDVYRRQPQKLLDLYLTTP